jgi:glutamyl-Q tRNA(Asp) synthetase
VNTGRYRGRFAPSPTGPLHFGSLLTAVGSFLDARAHDGEWLLRIEDLDPPREDPSATPRILATLRAHALAPDGEVLFQGTRHAAYAEAIERLERCGHAFRCSCSRTELEQGAGPHAPHCPSTGAQADRPTAVRVPARDLPAALEDLFLGHVDWSGLERGGSFVIRRRDGLVAYHLAVVVDDAFQGITHVVRGRDLLESTPCHLLLQCMLGFPSPAYGHLPLVLGADGNKLSKQNLATAVDDARAPANLLACLHALGQQEPPAALRDDCAAMLEWAAARWRRAAVPRGDLPAHAIPALRGGNGAGG